jgi:HEXXH motif-containing protein
MSASYREAPGLIYLSLHPSPLTMAEALIHETQHGKLNTLRWFDAVLLNGDSTWTPSPVRPDLRPLFGVLMAVHAFVPVAAFHTKLCELEHPISKSPPFEARAAQVLEGNAHGLATLRRLAEPTKLGRRVLDALEQLHSASGGDRVAQDDHELVAAL